MVIFFLQFFYSSSFAFVDVLFGDECYYVIVLFSMGWMMCDDYGCL